MDFLKKPLDANANEHGFGGHDGGLRHVVSTGSLVSSRRSRHRGISGFARTLLEQAQHGRTDASADGYIDDSVSPGLVRRLVVGQSLSTSTSAVTKSLDFSDCDQRTVKENVAPVATPMNAPPIRVEVSEKPAEHARDKKAKDFTPADLFHIDVDSNKPHQTRDEIAHIQPRKALSEEAKKVVEDRIPYSCQASKSDGHILISSSAAKAPVAIKPSPPHLEHDLHRSNSNGAFKIAAKIPAVPPTPNLVPTPASRKVFNKTPVAGSLGRSAGAALQQQRMRDSSGKNLDPYATVRKRMPKQEMHADKIRREVVGKKTYMVAKLLGQGAFGQVFKVVEEETLETYAMKKIPLGDCDPKILKECQNEIDHLVNLKSQKWVVRIHDWEFDRASGTMRIIMEYGNNDLGVTIRNSDELTLIDVKMIWQSMLRIVSRIHAKGVVHADLKPTNFVWVGNTLKIIDFGISSRIQADHTSVSMKDPKGTLNYISPETIIPVSGKVKVGPKSDIWALGCILHLMVYGKTPFADFPQYAKMQAIAHCNYTLEPLPAKFEKTSVQDVLRMCLQREPHARPSAEELLEHEFLTG